MVEIMEDKIRIFKIILLIVFVLLVFKAFQLQVLDGNYYYNLSEGNRTSFRPISAPRGKIIDRNGEILVNNKLSHNLYLLPNEIPPQVSIDALLKNIANYTSLTYDNLLENYNLSKDNINNQGAFILKRNIKKEDMVILLENNNELPGVLVKESSIRDYVYGDLAAHLIGYVGEINKEELRYYSKQGIYSYHVQDMLGKSGLEKEYEEYLKGIDGIRQVEVNNLGAFVQELGVKDPVPGHNIILNIDLKFQQKVERILESHIEKLIIEAQEDDERSEPIGGSAIILNPNNGKVLAMSSYPNFNLNTFTTGLSEEDYFKLSSDPRRPMLDRNIMVSVPPGSLFKLVTGTAAIKYLDVKAESEFNDPNGLFYIPGWSRPFRNWHGGGEGSMDFTKALARSNNIIFYKLGYNLYQEHRGEKLVETAINYGLGQKTNIDLPGEKKGKVPEEALNSDSNSWYPGDSVNLSIGQGDLLTTPIQMANYISAIANKGTLYRPYILDEIVDFEGKVIFNQKSEILHELDYDNRLYNILQQGMEEVTMSSYGTARSTFRDFPIEVSGKTGTAQTSIEDFSHGWFGGFAPSDDPEIVVLVFLENGGSSTYTLPIAGDIIKEYFNVNIDQDEEKKRDENANNTKEDGQSAEKTNEKKESSNSNLFEYIRDVFSSKKEESN